MLHGEWNNNKENKSKDENSFSKVINIVKSKVPSINCLYSNAFPSFDLVHVSFI